MSCNNARHRRLSLLVLFALLAAVPLAACGARGAGSAGRGPVPTEEASARIVQNADGTLAFEALQGPFARYPYYRVIPTGWPASQGEAPTLAFGEIGHRGDRVWPIEWASRQLNPNIERKVVGTGEPSELAESKEAARIEQVSDSQIRIDRGLRQGVAKGDTYFVLNREPAGDDVRPRFGQRIGALIQVREVGEEYALATLIHADVAPRAGDVGVFAQVQSEEAIPAATLAFAPVAHGHTRQDDEEMPAIASALPDYLSDYLISNIAITTLDAPIDPRPWNAPRLALDSAPENAFGTLIFGDIDEERNEFIYNATYFGDAPHPANTVGILPGGLRIPLDDGLEALSRQLVPGFVATALAQRHEHAAAIYLLESALRTGEFNEQVRYHLHEHLALRYESIGRPDLAFDIISADIERSRQSGNVLAELNALSIRAFLDSQASLNEQWVDDTEQFLARARGVLPPESLDYERLSLARALRAAQRHDEARDITLEVLDTAQSTNDSDLLFSTFFQLALTELDLGQPQAALLVLADLEDLEDELSVPEKADLYSVAGLLYAEAGEPREAANRIVQSLRIAADSDDASLQARIAARAASALVSIGRSREAIQYLQSAVVGYTESYQFNEAAELLAQLAYQELQAANDANPRDGSAAHLVALAREHLANASESLVVLGRTLEAATQFFALGILEFRIGNVDASRIFLDRARLYSWQSADYEALAAIAHQRASLAAETGNVTDEQQFLDEAALWMEAGGLSDE